MGIKRIDFSNPHWKEEYLNISIKEIREIHNKIVLSYDTYFDGAEIDWTCCHPDYRCRGIISDMLGIVLKSAKNDVYCKRLRTYQNEYANLHSIMIKYGFTCVKRNYKEFHISNDIICEICPYKNDNIACVCYEDLYVMWLKGK